MSLLKDFSFIFVYLTTQYCFFHTFCPTGSGCQDRQRGYIRRDTISTLMYLVQTCPGNEGVLHVGTQVVKCAYPLLAMQRFILKKNIFRPIFFYDIKDL